MYDVEMELDEQVVYLEPAFMMIAQESIPIMAVVTNRRLMIFKETIDEVAHLEFLKKDRENLYPPAKELLLVIHLEDFRDFDDLGFFNKYTKKNGEYFQISNDGIVEAIFKQKKEN